MKYNYHNLRVINKINNNSKFTIANNVNNNIQDNNKNLNTNNQYVNPYINNPYINNAFYQNYAYYLGYTKAGLIYPDSVTSYQILSNIYLREPQASNPDINSCNNNVSTTQFVNQTINKPFNYININVPSYNIQYNSNFIVGLNFIITVENSNVYLPTNCPLGTHITIINNNPINNTSNVNILTSNGDIIINTISSLTEPYIGTINLNIPSANICNLVYLIQANENIWRTIVY